MVAPSCGVHDSFHVYVYGVDSDLGEQSPSYLGAAAGSDAHCRTVCAAVAGCNLVLRAANSTRCSLFSDCEFVGEASTRTTEKATEVACAHGPLAMTMTTCRATAQWFMLPTPLRNEGDNLGAVNGVSVAACRRACEVTPSCNYLNIELPPPGKRGKREYFTCWLKTRCVSGPLAGQLPQRARDRALHVSLRGRHQPTTSASMLEQAAFHYRFPCSLEVANVGRCRPPYPMPI